MFAMSLIMPMIMVHALRAWKNVNFPQIEPNFPWFIILFFMYEKAKFRTIFQNFHQNH